MFHDLSLSFKMSRHDASGRTVCFKMTGLDESGYILFKIS